MGSIIHRREVLKLAGLLPLAGLPAVLPSINPLFQGQAASGPNVLVVVFDALSALNMSLYGYPRETTPNISRFAGKAAVYHRHYAGGTYTTPGVASLLTGTLPWTHHALNLSGTVISDYRERSLFNLLPGGTYTNTYSHNLLAIHLLDQFRHSLDQLGMPRLLALRDLQYSDLLFKSDYHVAASAENIILRGNQTVAGSLFLSFLYRWLGARTETQLRAAYHDQYPQGVPEQDGVFFRLEDSIDWTIEQVRAMPAPYLAYFHYLPPHDPYKPPGSYLGLFNNDLELPQKPASFASEGFDDLQLERNRRQYDRHVAFVDAEFGRLIAALEEDGALENTYVILTSDHGEMFERGIRGHFTPVMYEPLVRIPLLIAGPGITTRQDIHEPTSCADLLPTILNLHQAAVPDWVEGRMLPMFSKQPGGGDRPIFSIDNKSHTKNQPLEEGNFMVVLGDYKLISYPRASEDRPPDELYNLAEDPEELNNLAADRPAIAADLQALLDEQLQRANARFSS